MYFETRLAHGCMMAQLSHRLLLLGHLGGQKYPCFISVAAAFCLNPQGLSVEAVTPDMMLVETWGLGFSLQQKQLCLRRFLCSRFHYIRVQQGGGELRDGWDTGTQ